VETAFTSGVTVTFTIVVDLIGSVMVSAPAVKNVMK